MSHVTDRKLQGKLWYKVQDLGWHTYRVQFAEWENPKYAYQAYDVDDENLVKTLVKLDHGGITPEAAYEVVFAYHENLLRELRVLRQGHPDYLENGEPKESEHASTFIPDDVTEEVAA